jgi:hypothetical protein
MVIYKFNDFVFTALSGWGRGEPAGQAHFFTILLLMGELVAGFEATPNAVMLDVSSFR